MYPRDYKPFSFQLPDQSFEGLDVDLVSALANSLGAKPQWVKSSWANLLPDMVGGKCDMAVGVFQ